MDFGATRKQIFLDLLFSLSCTELCATIRNCSGVPAALAAACSSFASVAAVTCWTWRRQELSAEHLPGGCQFLRPLDFIRLPRFRRTVEVQVLPVHAPQNDYGCDQKTKQFLAESFKPPWMPWKFCAGAWHVLGTRLIRGTLGQTSAGKRTSTAPSVSVSLKASVVVGTFCAGCTWP